MIMEVMHRGGTESHKRVDIKSGASNPDSRRFQALAYKASSYASTAFEGWQPCRAIEDTGSRLY